MFSFTQIDPQWNKEILTHHSDQKEPDYIEDWGCLLVSYANILNHRGYNITPKNLNDKLKANLGYLYLYDKSVDAGVASFLRSEIIEKYYNCSIINIENKSLKYNINIYYIAMIKSKLPIMGKVITVNHFINVIEEDDKNNKICFDVYNGEIKKISNNKILKLKRMVF